MSTAVAPDLVIMGTGKEVISDPWEDGCPVCGSFPHDAPEGVHDVHSVRKYPGVAVGDPKWNFEHCWKCGCRPATDKVLSTGALQAQFEKFKAMISAEFAKGNQLGLVAPANADEVAQLQADLERSKADNLALIEQLKKANGDV